MAQGTGPHAVDDADGSGTVEDGIVQIFVDDGQRLIDVHADDVALQLERMERIVFL